MHGGDRNFLQETATSNAWYEVLSVLHLMSMLLLSQANLLLLPRSSSDGHQHKVSDGKPYYQMIFYMLSKIFVCVCTYACASVCWMLLSMAYSLLISEQVA